MEFETRGIALHLPVKECTDLQRPNQGAGGRVSHVALIMEATQEIIIRNEKRPTDMNSLHM